MKTRICLILATLMVTLSLVGCQQSAAQTDAKVGESAKTAPPQNVCKTTWEEKCSVKQASAATKRALEGLGLGGSDKPKTRTVTTRDPKTGRTISKQVPVASSSSGSGSVSLKSDGLSAIVKAKSVSGIAYDISILLMPPESCEISIMATGSNPTDILKEHSVFIKQKISEAIQNPEPEAVAEPAPYPKTMVFDRALNEVYNVLQRWKKEMQIESDGNSGGDSFYKYIPCKTASRIRLVFRMRMIDTNKTKLEMDVQGYEGKEEFPMILKSLEEALAALEKDKNTSDELTPAAEKQK